MACRSAILIDNFLPQVTFDTLSSKVSASSDYNIDTVVDRKDDLWTEVYTEVFVRLKDKGIN